MGSTWLFGFRWLLATEAAATDEGVTYYFDCTQVQAPVIAMLFIASSLSMATDVQHVASAVENS